MVWAWALAMVLTAAPERHVAWLPETLAGARRTEAPQVWNRETVFDYMDGKAELYLTYGMTQVTTAPYEVAGQRVAVMLFELGGPAEAFGIFSNDLAGERVPGLQDARYHAGVLRGWQGPLMLKVEGEEDQPEVKQFALAMAKVIGERQPPGEPRPPLAAALPTDRLGLRDLRYFHQVSCLDAIYYVSTQNVLALDALTDGLFAEGTLDGKPLKVLLVQYRDLSQRDRAWEGYTTKVLTPKAATGPAGERTEALDAGLFSGARKVLGPEGEPRLLLCFEAPTAEACRTALAAMAVTAGAREGGR